MRSTIFRFVLAAAVVVAAFIVLLFGAVIDWLACEVDSSEACGRMDLATLQFVVAGIGLVPSLLLGTALVARWRRVGVATLVLVAATYTLWGMLADAAVHGWDDLKFFPS